MNVYVVYATDHEDYEICAVYLDKQLAINRVKEVAENEFQSILASYEISKQINKYHSLHKGKEVDQWEIHYKNYATRFFGVEEYPIQDA